MNVEKNTFYATRDKDSNLTLWYYHKPTKIKESGWWDITDKNTIKYSGIIQCGNVKILPEIRWKDDEPTLVKLEII